MSDDKTHYHPVGIPVTPQAHQFGYEFPVYVSKCVWSAQCLWVIGPKGKGTTPDRRIVELLGYCYGGMIKKLSVQDDFTSYSFKVWYWCPVNRDKKKQRRVRLGARLFLVPEKDTPWLYIFNPDEDTFDDLDKASGEPT